MALLSKDEIMGAEDRPWVDVHVPEWMGTVRIRAMTGEQRDLFDQAFSESTDVRTSKVRNFRALMIASSAVNEAGEQIFSMDDVIALGQKNSAAMDRLFSAALSINKMTKADAEQIVGN